MTQDDLNAVDPPPERSPAPAPRERQESGFAAVERAGAEAMAERPEIRDEDGRRIIDPGQQQRAPEERSTVHQALLDEEAQRRDQSQSGAPL